MNIPFYRRANPSSPWYHQPQKQLPAKWMRRAFFLYVLFLASMYFEPVLAFSTVTKTYSVIRRSASHQRTYSKL